MNDFKDYYESRDGIFLRAKKACEYDGMGFFIHALERMTHPDDEEGIQIIQDNIIGRALSAFKDSGVTPLGISAATSDGNFDKLYTYLREHVDDERYQKWLKNNKVQPRGITPLEVSNCLNKSSTEKIPVTHHDGTERMKYVDLDLCVVVGLDTYDIITVFRPDETAEEVGDPFDGDFEFEYDEYDAEDDCEFYLKR